MKFTSAVAFLFFVPLIAVVLAGCSQKSGSSASADDTTHNSDTNGLPFTVVIVNSKQSQEQSDLAVQAQTCFEKKEYEKLEKMATRGSSSAGAWATGDWPIDSVFRGLTLSGNCPDDVWVARQHELESWVNSSSESVIARLALANHLVYYAWKVRGSGFADTVSDQAQKQYTERLEQAAKVLSEAAKMGQKSPFYWNTLMTVARGLQFDRATFDGIFKQAVQAWPDYAPIYIQRAMYLLPRWYGNAGEWQADLKESADRKGGKNGDILYAQVVLAMIHFSEHHNVFEDDNDLSWERIDRGWTDAESVFPDSIEAISAHAEMAGLAGDQELASRYLTKTEGKVTLGVWSSKEEFIQFARYAFGR